MGNVSRPLSSGGSQGLGTYQSAITAAHRAVGTSNAASAAQGGVVASAPATSAKPAAVTTSTRTPVANARPAVPGTVHAASATRHRLDVVSRALAEHRVFAMLFYNPPAADDQAVKQELAAVPTHGESWGSRTASRSPSGSRTR